MAVQWLVYKVSILGSAIKVVELWRNWHFNGGQGVQNSSFTCKIFQRNSWSDITIYLLTPSKCWGSVGIWSEVPSIKFWTDSTVIAWKKKKQLAI